MSVRPLHRAALAVSTIFATACQSARADESAAEAYHQGYYDLHPNQPYIVYNDKPKVEALRVQFPDLYQMR